ncbi:hypothetical protein [Streptomyces sp. HUAS ZL42]|uniref:hypothetical protein n=1 Tax=Streptomyces sp. HUAS ZL42 TaxID=3231715 RepID=UPI00345E9DF6
MRRTARVLSVVALAGAALVTAAPAGFADPAAQAWPSGATGSVSCDTSGDPAPEAVDPTSQGADEGTAGPQRVPGPEDETSGPAYRGTARTTPAPAAGSAGSTGEVGTEDVGPATVDPDAGPPDGETETIPSDDVVPAPAWTTDGACPTQPGGRSESWSATSDAHRGDGESCGQVKDGHPKDTDCPAPAIQHGVHAGEGGAFTDSVPALVAGGLLIAGALGAAVHRLGIRDSRPG